MVVGREGKVRFAGGENERMSNQTVIRQTETGREGRTEVANRGRKRIRESAGSTMSS